MSTWRILSLYGIHRIKKPTHNRDDSHCVQTQNSEQEPFFLLWQKTILQKITICKCQIVFGYVYLYEFFAIWNFRHLWITPQKFWAISRAKRLVVFFSKASQASFKYERVSLSVRNIVSDLFSQHLWFERREKLTKKNHWC